MILLTLPLWALITVLLIIPAVQLTVWLIRTGKRVPEAFYRRFRRGRVVRVNLLTRSGRVEERYAIPDARGIMRIDQGAYHFNKDVALINAQFGIPEITLMENQVYAQSPELVAVEGPMLKVKSPSPDGELIEVERSVPSWVLGFRHANPQKLIGFTAKEIREALDSKIVRDIVQATARELSMVRMLVWVTVGVGALTLIGFIILAKLTHDNAMLMDEARRLLVNHTAPTLLKGVSMQTPAGGG